MTHADDDMGEWALVGLHYTQQEQPIQESRNIAALNMILSSLTRRRCFSSRSLSDICLDNELVRDFDGGGDGDSGGGGGVDGLVGGVRGLLGAGDSGLPFSLPLLATTITCRSSCAAAILSRRS